MLKGLVTDGKPELAKFREGGVEGPLLRCGGPVRSPMAVNGKGCQSHRNS